MLLHFFFDNFTSFPLALILFKLGEEPATPSAVTFNQIAGASAAFIVPTLPILKKLKTDKDFVEKLLEKAEVAVVQGSAFGLDGYFRISYATSMENLKKAMDRIKSFCNSLN